MHFANEKSRQAFREYGDAFKEVTELHFKKYPFMKQLLLNHNSGKTELVEESGAGVTDGHVSDFGRLHHERIHLVV